MINECSHFRFFTAIFLMFFSFSTRFTASRFTLQCIDNDFECNLLLISTSKFFKDKKLHESVGLLQFLVFKEFTSTYIQQISLEIML